jgi:arsenate reductase (glutaredoxin)
LQKKGVPVEFRDLDRERLTVEELDRLIGNRDYREFLNTRNEMYRKKKMKENPPSREEAIRMMAKEPNLIRRPVILCGGRIVLGYDEETIENL